MKLFSYFENELFWHFTVIQEIDISQMQSTHEILFQENIDIVRYQEDWE